MVCCFLLLVWGDQNKLTNFSYVTLQRVFPCHEKHLSSDVLCLSTNKRGSDCRSRQEIKREQRKKKQMWASVFTHSLAFCLQVCVVLALRNAASVSTRSRSPAKKWSATSRPASDAPSLLFCEYRAFYITSIAWTRRSWPLTVFSWARSGWTWRQVISCVSDLQPRGWRSSSAPWKPSTCWERALMCNHGDAGNTFWPVMCFDATRSNLQTIRFYTFYIQSICWLFLFITTAGMRFVYVS